MQLWWLIGGACVMGVSYWSLKDRWRHDVCSTDDEWRMQPRLHFYYYRFSLPHFRKDFWNLTGPGRNYLRRTPKEDGRTFPNPFQHFLKHQFIESDSHFWSWINSNDNICNRPINRTEIHFKKGKKKRKEKKFKNNKIVESDGVFQAAALTD